MNDQHGNGLEPHIREGLRRKASIPPPARVDRRILRRIRRRPVLKPWVAGGVAVAGLIAMVTWLAVLFAESELNLAPLPAAALTALIYLALCSVATMPLILNPGRFALVPRTLEEKS